mmetsp:Transcript_42635/g.100001  ORF Transcript_42635/g.100001 Transcript_42635/m.100001 type:complete len:234 (+) Transcript_42635:213-914(+)
MPMAMPSVLLSPPAQPTPSSSGPPHVTPLGGSERAADSASIRPPPGAPPVLPAQPTPVPLTQPTPSGSGPPQRRNSRPAGIYADLDTGDEEDEDTGNDTSSSSECLFSTFRHALQRRLQKELTGDGTWLLNMLRESAGAGECWRLPAARVNVACKKLSLGPINEAYCRDIVVWLPDIQFKQMPPCGECRSASAVAPPPSHPPPSSPPAACLWRAYLWPPPILPQPAPPTPTTR